MHISKFCLLLAGGTVITHDDQDRPTAVKADILVEGNRIAQIAPQISEERCSKVINCTNKIISPGFVDTHHHVWETALKGFFADLTFFSYLAKMNAAGKHFKARDMFWGTLTGSMEAIDAGTTTVLDHAYINWSEDHSRNGLAGILSSGIRAIWAYTPIVPITQFTPEVKFEPDALPTWVIQAFERLARSSPLNQPDSRVKLGLGMDLYFLPKELLQTMFSRVKELGVKMITSHFVKHFEAPGTSTVEKLRDLNLLHEGMVFSHAGAASASDIQLLRDANCFISSTPSTELSMAVGPVAVFNDGLRSVNDISSLGIDCHSATSSSLVNEMRIALQWARGNDSNHQVASGDYDDVVEPTTDDAFNLATIKGARAMYMEDEIGSLKDGKMADLIIFKAITPSMIAAAQYDPVAAIVMHSSIRDIETVIIDGHIRKQDGKLLPVAVAEWEGEDLRVTKRQLTWQEAAEQIVQVQKGYVDKMPEYNLTGVEAAYRQQYGVE